MDSTVLPQMFLVLMVTLACTGFCMAQDAEKVYPFPEDGPWEQITFLSDLQKEAGRKVGGEGGQQIYSMCYSESDPQRIIFGVDVAGVWGSDDGGNTWSMYKGNMLANKIQGGVAIDPANKDVFYAWSTGRLKYHGLYRTLDGGCRWQRVLDSGNSSSKGKRFIFIPDEKADKALGHTATVLTSAMGTVMISKDGGANFEPFAEIPHDDEDKKFSIKYLALFCSDPLRLAVGTTNGLFQVEAGKVSMIGGRLPENPNITGMAQHPTQPRVIWVTVDNKLFRSNDFGDTFDDISVDNLKFKDIHVSRVDGNILYNPCGYQTMYYSHDGGFSWAGSIVDEGLCSRHSGGWSQGFDSHPENPMEALACFGDRIFRTTNGGITWTDTSTYWTGTRTTTRNAIYFHPKDPKVMGIGSLDWGFFYTVNGGETWRYCWAQGIPRSRSVIGLLMDPRGDWETGEGPQRILAVSGGWREQMLIRSEDGGAWLTPSEGKQTWITYEDIRRQFAHQTSAYNSNHPGMVYMGNQKSLDWGVTWKALEHSIHAYAYSNPDIVYSINKYEDGSGLMISKDCGETWMETKGRLKQNIKCIDVAPDNPDLVYAATDHGIACWTNGEWQVRKEESGLRKDGFGVFSFSSIAVDLKHPNRVYAGAWADYFGNSSGIWASEDRGVTWKNISQNLGPMSIWAVAVDPHTGAVYAGTSYGHWVLRKPFSK